MDDKTMRGRHFYLATAAGVIALTSLFGLGSPAAAQTPTGTKQPYFAPKRVLLLQATMPSDKSKTLAPELEDAAKRTLRNLFSAPQYRAVTDVAFSSLPGANRPDAASPEPSPADITRLLVTAGEKAQADTVILAVVRDANREQVTLSLWRVDVKTGKAYVEGQKLRRSWDDYPQTKPTSDGGYTTSITLPPLRISGQERLIARMLTEWSGVPETQKQVR